MFLSHFPKIHKITENLTSEQVEHAQSRFLTGITLMFTLPKLLSLSGAPDSSPVFSGVHVCSIFSIFVAFCRYLFVFFCFFCCCWLHVYCIYLYLSFLDLWLLITPSSDYPFLLITPSSDYSFFWLSLPSDYPFFWLPFPSDYPFLLITPSSDYPFLLITFFWLPLRYHQTFLVIFLSIMQFLRREELKFQPIRKHNLS